MAWLTPLVAGLGALALVYALLLHLRPAALRRQATAPLLDLGLSGHVAAAAYRLPHIAVQFLGAWVPFLFFGVEIPFADALALMPLLMFVVVLPIAPQGLGTRDAAAIALLSPYALGTAPERAAQIAATTLSWLGAITLVQVVLSPLFLRPAYRLLGMEGR